MASAKKPMTAAQTERQHDQFRDGGKYHTMNPCELCGKGVGADYFTSKHHGEKLFGGKGLILHKACCTKLDAMSEDDALKALHLAPAPKAGAAKPAIPNPPAPTPAMLAIDHEIAAIRKQLDTIGMGDSFKLKMDLMNLRTQRARLWKEQTAGVDAKVVKVWQKWAKGMG